MSLIFKTELEIIGKNKTVKIDCTTDLTESISTNISSFPLEIGTNIADHIHPNPESLSINGIITDNKILKLISFGDSADDKRDILRNFALQSERLDISYGDYFFESYAINSLSIIKNSDLGKKSFSASIGFQKILVAKTGKTIIKGRTPIQSFPKKSILKGIFG